MPTAPASPLRSYRILTAALMGALVIIGVALLFTVGSDRTDRDGNPVRVHAPGLWMYVVIVGLGLVVAAIIQTFGYRIPALPSNVGPTEARVTALRLYQQSMMLRFALSDSVAIVAIALLFAGRSNTILPYVVAAAIAELLMVYHVWPSHNLIGRVQRRLDRDGGRSELSRALGEAG